MSVVFDIIKLGQELIYQCFSYSGSAAEHPSFGIIDEDPQISMPSAVDHMHQDEYIRLKGSWSQEQQEIDCFEDTFCSSHMLTFDFFHR